MATDLTTEARAGYDGNAPTAYYSSPVWYAQTLGKYLHDTGRAPPYGVRMSRGTTMHANGKRWSHDDKAGWSLVQS